jgi:hypothetical protein
MFNPYYYVSEWEVKRISLLRLNPTKERKTLIIDTFSRQTEDKVYTIWDILVHLVLVKCCSGIWCLIVEFCRTDCWLPSASITKDFTRVFWTEFCEFLLNFIKIWKSRNSYPILSHPINTSWIWFTLRTRVVVQFPIL